MLPISLIHGLIPGLVVFRALSHDLQLLLRDDDVLLHDIVPHLTRIVIVALEQRSAGTRRHPQHFLWLLLELALAFLPGKTAALGFGHGLAFNLIVIIFGIGCEKSVILLLRVRIFAIVYSFLFLSVLVGVIGILIVFTIGFFDLFIELVHLVCGHE